MTSRTVPGNGELVSWRELNLVMAPVHEKLDELGDGIRVLLDERSEARGRIRIRKSALTGLALFLSSGWWLPDLVHRFH